jgi:hypothetical protein
MKKEKTFKEMNAHPAYIFRFDDIRTFICIHKTSS